MRFSNIQAGDRLFYNNGHRVRPVTILSTDRVQGPGVGQKGKGVQLKKCWMKARFDDDGTVDFVSTKGLRRAPDDPGRLNYYKSQPPAPVSARGDGRTDTRGITGIIANSPADNLPAVEPKPHVEITFYIGFTVPITKAGIIDTVMSMLRDEGEAELLKTAEVSDD